MKKNSLPVLILMLLLLVAVLAGAEDSSIAAIYAKHGVEGTIIISSLSGEVEYLHNEERSNRRFLPASTFKILNTLIALEEGVIQDEKEIIKWDGHDKGWAPWNKDQTLSTAFSLSCVWCYQEFAKQIGGETYSKYLSNLDYGNRKTGLGITTFWLEGDLAISAREQITFLRKLYLEQLPFKSQNIQLLKKIMIVDKTPEYTLRAKTGWARRIKEQHGWYVGYLEVRGKVWLFANNIKINKRADTKFSRKLVIESLKAKGIL